MEHRWGERVQVDVPIRLIAAPLFLVKSGQLRNLSVSGGFIAADVGRHLPSEIQVDLGRLDESRRITARVVRKLRGGFGVEWSTLTPATLVEFLRAASAHRYVHPEWADQVA